MKIRIDKRFKLISMMVLAAWMVVGVSGCQREVGTLGDEQRPVVAISPSVDVTAPDSRLTVSHGNDKSEFEADDVVGLFLFDKGSSIYSFSNITYTARVQDGRVIFSPVLPVYYKTYYLHDIYAYFPYLLASSNAAAVSHQISLDQSLVTSYVASDFLCCKVADVKPQQISPAAPEIPMNFTHQMTSVVVKVKNADGSAIVPEPIVRVLNTNTKANIDITAGGTLSGKSNLAPVVMRRNAAGDVLTELFYDAIVMPQTVTAGKALISIQIGTGPLSRTFDYVPKADDDIAKASLTQGLEHIFTITIHGTQINVDGGQIQAWGTGLALSQDINGGGISASKLIFELTNDGANKMATAKSAKLTIDGKERATTRVVYEASPDGGVTPAKISLIYYQGTDWGYDFSQVILYNEAGTQLCGVTASSAIRIKGDPTSDRYSTVIGSIDVDGGHITAK